MDLDEIVQSLGLGKKEARVYVALLELGVASPYVISRKSGLKRPTTYVILDSLAQKGAVSVIPQSGKKLYRSTPPEGLLEKAELRLRTVKENLPKIKAIEDRGAQKLSVEYYEGVEGMKEVLRYGRKQMAGKEYVGFYASGSEEVQKQFGKFDENSRALKELNIKIRGIVPLDPRLNYYRRTDIEFGRKMKTVPPSDLSSTVAFEIGDTFTKIYDMENLQGIVIENENVTRTLKQIFEMVWKKL